MMKLTGTYEVPAPRERGVEHVAEDHIQGDQCHEGRECGVDRNAEECFGDLVGPVVHARECGVEEL